MGRCLSSFKLTWHVNPTFANPFVVYLYLVSKNLFPRKARRPSNKFYNTTPTNTNRHQIRVLRSETDKVRGITYTLQTDSFLTY
mmetsp:Transcript_23588/g.42540  ORF Transcript_23588/g.42540 Transcript_23588/m.42540 type:complete len:84 (-) Transcript_23588:208-459(-)